MDKIFNSATITKNYIENGKEYRATIVLKLYQIDGNKMPYFSFTADIREKQRNGRYAEYMGGCCLEEIKKCLSDFDDLVKLHLSDNNGIPLYAYENGAYWIRENIKKGADYLRISEDEAEKLPLDDKFAYFKALEDMGILDRWQKEAKAVIKYIEAHK